MGKIINGKSEEQIYKENVDAHMAESVQHRRIYISESYPDPMAGEENDIWLVIPPKPVVDQSNPITNQNKDTNVATGIQLAVSFTPTVTAVCKKVRVWGRWRADFSDGTADVLITIHPDNAGLPSDTLVDAGYSATILYDGNTTTHEMIARFTSTIELQASTKYWIVVTAINSSTENSQYYQFKTNTTNAYTAGEGARHNGASWSSFSEELCFEEYRA